MSFKRIFIWFCICVHLSLSNSSKLTQRNVEDNTSWLARAITTSQVLTFNITNAIILLGFKAIVIGAGILGGISFWKYPNLGGVPVFREDGTRVPGMRSAKSDDTVSNQIYYSIFSDEDKRWSAAYIWAVNKKDFGCLYRLACEHRASAQIYLYSGRFYIKAVDSIFGFLNLSYDRGFYENILNGIERAMKSQPGTCLARFKCSSPL